MILTLLLWSLSTAVSKEKQGTDGIAYQSAMRHAAGSRAAGELDG